jgi:hypothetical protein
MFEDSVTKRSLFERLFGCCASLIIKNCTEQPVWVHFIHATLNADKPENDGAYFHDELTNRFVINAGQRSEAFVPCRKYTVAFIGVETVFVRAFDTVTDRKFTVRSDHFHTSAL